MNKFSEPKTITKTLEIHSFEASIICIVFNKYANISIALYDKDGLFIGTGGMMIEGEDYAKWGAEDDYVNEYIIAHFDKIILM